MEEKNCFASDFHFATGLSTLCICVLEADLKAITCPIIQILFVSMCLCGIWEKWMVTASLRHIICHHIHFFYVQCGSMCLCLCLCLCHCLCLCILLYFSLCSLESHLKIYAHNYLHVFLFRYGLPSSSSSSNPLNACAHFRACTDAFLILFPNILWIYFVDSKNTDFEWMFRYNFLQFTFYLIFFLVLSFILCKIAKVSVYLNFICIFSSS